MSGHGDFPPYPGGQAEATDLLIGVAVDQFLKREDFQDYLAVLKKVLPPLLHELFPHGLDERGMATMCHVIGRAVWAQCPDPASGFRTRGLPKPSRNSPCPCGSGEKYKHCCANAPSFNQLPMLRHVVRNWPQSRFREIGFRHLDPAEIGAVAHEWIEEGHERRAMKFLEAFFAATEQWDGRMEFAFDLLVDLYQEFGHPRKKQRLVEQALESRDPALRAVAMQRKATILMDRGEYQGAWSAFQEAQRLDPDSPSLGVLEVTMLIAQNRFEEAKARAGFWKARLERQGIEDLEDLTGFLEKVAEDPLEAFAELVPTRNLAGQLHTLLEETAELPPAERLVRIDEECAYLEPLEPVREALWRWRELFPQEPGLDGIRGVEEWLSLLRKEPRLLVTFDVLDDLGLSLQELVLSEEEFLDLNLRLGERAEEMLKTLLQASGKGGIRRLEWGWMENRPALRLIARYAALLTDTDPEKAAERMAWLLELSPNDNLGMRIPLVHLYCGLGKIGEAKSLTERHPDDFPTMGYGKVLAHYVAGERGKALSMLSGLYREYPRILDTLVAENPREPARWSPYGTTVGGEDEAWLYRREFLRYWRDTGALDWVRQAYPSLPR